MKESGIKGLTTCLLISMFLLLSFGKVSLAQSSFGGEGYVHGSFFEEAVDTTAISGEEESIALMPSDVLTPNTRRNTPYWKIALRAGINRSAYTNDRYLDNTPLDVGEVSGESEIYSASSGFGYQFGLDVEYPLNTGFSFVFSGEYDHVTFGGSGNVQGDLCLDANGDTLGRSSIHEFSASLDYVKFGVSSKLNFSSFYLLLGLTAANAISTELESTRTHGGVICYYPANSFNRKLQGTSEIPDVAGLHYALRMGLGLVYDLTDRLQFSPELILDFGMNAINKSPESDLGVYSISAVLRYDIF